MSALLFLCKCFRLNICLDYNQLKAADVTRSHVANLCTSQEASLQSKQSFYTDFKQHGNIFLSILWDPEILGRQMIMFPDAVLRSSFRTK